MFSKKTLAVFSLVFMAFGFALMGIASRWMAEGFGNMTQVALRTLGAFVLTAIIFYQQISWKKIINSGAKTLSILTLIGVLGYAGMVYSITVGALTTKLINVAVIYSTLPFFVYLGGLVMWQRKVSKPIIGFLLLSVWGVAILTSGSILPTLAGFGKGEIYVLAATIFEAIYFIGLKLLDKQLNSREIAVASLLIGGLAALAMSILLGEPLNLSAFANWHVTSALIFGILQNVWVPLLIMFAFAHINEVIATQLFLLESFFSLLLGYFLYSEVVSIFQLGGAGLIIVSVYYMNKLEAK